MQELSELRYGLGSCFDHVSISVHHAHALARRIPYKPVRLDLIRGWYSYRKFRSSLVIYSWVSSSSIESFSWQRMVILFNLTKPSVYKIVFRSMRYIRTANSYGDVSDKASSLTRQTHPPCWQKRAAILHGAQALFTRTDLSAFTLPGPVSDLCAFIQDKIYT